MPISIDRVIRSRRKTIALVVEADGSLVVRAPLRMADNDIRRFVDTHREWIAKSKLKILRNPPPPPRQYREGESFPFLGKAQPLKIVPQKSPALALHASGFRLAKGSLGKADALFLRWYRKQARRVIVDRVETLAGLFNYSYQKIRISSARTRWGSCSARGTLSFTWRLVMAPPEVVDYVVIHELVHTRIKNHSKVFWEQVGKLMPGYKKHVRWLKQNGKYLTL